MGIAFVLGNGRSRLAVDLHKLQTHGMIYGCNGLYREFAPDCLVATDSPIARSIQESGYAKNNRFHTRRPIEGTGAKSLPKDYRGFSSGPNAVAQACLDGHYQIYLLGFDLGTTNGQFNNVYADTEFYKRITDPPTFAGNWIKQIRTLCEQFSDREFVRVQGPESAHIAVLNEINNMRHRTMQQFKETLNI